MKQFKNSIVTTKEQSEQLIALGLRPETADFRYQSWNEYNDGSGTWGKAKLCMGFNAESSAFNRTCRNVIETPSWSLSRLLEIIPRYIHISEIIRENATSTALAFWELSLTPTEQYKCNYHCHKPEQHYEAHGNTNIEAICNMLEKLIRDKLCNKEYLK